MLRKLIKPEKLNEKISKFVESNLNSLRKYQKSICYKNISTLKQL